jgi:uncharacterized DUF497 family protein
MEIEFDTAKDLENRAKHGVPLAIGLHVLDAMMGEVEDTRHDYGETRMQAFGMVEGRLFVCVYTLRGDVYRLISVRKASRQEQRSWLP